MTTALQDAIEKAFVANDNVLRLEKEFEEAKGRRDIILSDLIKAAGVSGPFVRGGSTTKYQVVTRGTARFFRRVKEQKK